MERDQKKPNETCAEQETIALKVLQLLHRLHAFKGISVQQEPMINYNLPEEQDFMELELEENRLVILVQCAQLHNTEPNHHQLVLLVLPVTIDSNILMMQINILRCQELILVLQLDY